MGDDFNPYEEWLGLDGRVSQPNYYQLFGVDPGESDRHKIAASADRAMSRVRSCRPGKNAAAWAALLDELATAKRCLIDPAQRADYDRRFGDQAGSRGVLPQGLDHSTAPQTSTSNLYPPAMAAPSPPAEEFEAAESSAAPMVPAGPDAADYLPPLAPGSPDPSQPDSLQPPVPEVAFPEVPVPEVPFLQPADDIAAGLPLDPMAPLQPLAGDASDPMAPAVPHAGPDPMAPVLPTAVDSLLQPDSPPGPIAQPGVPADPLPPAIVPQPVLPAASSGVPGDPPASPTAPVVSAPATTQEHEPAGSGILIPLMVGVLVGLSILTAFGLYRNWGDSRERNGPDQKAAAEPSAQPLEREIPSGDRAADPTGVIADQAGRQAAPPDPSGPAPLESRQQQMPDPLPPLPTTFDPLPGSAPAMDRGATAEPPTEPSPPAPTQPSPRPTDEQLIELGRRLADARAALIQRDFSRANQLLAAAESLAILDDHRAKLDRLKRLAQYAREFRAAIDQAAANLEAAESFLVGTSTMVSVIEANPEKLVIRAGGQRREYPMDDLPLGLAVALAEQSLAQDDPRTLLRKGAYVAVSRHADQDALNKARGWWEQAATQLDEARELIGVLDDQYDLVAQ